MNEPQILQWQGKVCSCFTFDLKWLSDSKILVSNRMFCQIGGPLKAIVLIPYFIIDLCLDASILGFF